MSYLEGQHSANWTNFSKVHPTPNSNTHTLLQLLVKCTTHFIKNSKDFNLSATDKSLDVGPVIYCPTAPQKQELHHTKPRK